jgi:hypothetical protein
MQYSIRREPLLISSWLPPGRGLFWDAEPGFELGPALQQADALLYELRRTLSELRRTLSATPHHSEQRRTLI